MKLQKLKATVYKLAEVNTIRQLKTKYNKLQPLDMRRKASWEKALAIVQQHQEKFATWLEDPPDEYKELFAEIERVSEGYDNQLAKLKQKQQAIVSIADDLEVLAQEIQGESKRLQQEAQIARQADLN